MNINHKWGNNSYIIKFCIHKGTSTFAVAKVRSLRVLSVRSGSSKPEQHFMYKSRYLWHTPSFFYQRRIPRYPSIPSQETQRVSLWLPPPPSQRDPHPYRPLNRPLIALPQVYLSLIQLSSPPGMFTLSCKTWYTPDLIMTLLYIFCCKGRFINFCRRKSLKVNQRQRLETTNFTGYSFTPLYVKISLFNMQIIAPCSCAYSSIKYSSLVSLSSLFPNL